MCEDMTQPVDDLQELTEYFQRRLRVQDVNADVRWATIHDMPNRDWFGSCAYNRTRNHADIQILLPSHRDPSARCPQSTRYTVIHELAHIKFDVLGIKVGDPQAEAEEQLIDWFARIIDGYEDELAALRAQLPAESA